MQGGWKFGIAGAITSLSTIFILGLATPGHDLVNGYISTLSQMDSPYRAWYIAGGTISAACHLLFVKELWRAGGRRTLLASALALLASFFVLHWIAAAFVPCDVDCAWLTQTGRLHYAMGFAAFVAVSVGIILFSVDLWRSNWLRQTPIHVAAGIMIASAIVLLVMDRLGLYHGIAERTSAVALAAWTIILALDMRLTEIDG